jgi:hypothetical protein
MPAAPDQLPDNIDFAAQDLLEVPVTQATSWRTRSGAISHTLRFHRRLDVTENNGREVEIVLESFDGSLWRNSLEAMLSARLPRASTGSGRFTIGITGRDGITWHLHLAAAEARQLVDYVDEHT